MKIAITGGIGSGKSTVLNYLKELGENVLSCDQINNDLLNSKNYIEKIAKIFPKAIENEKVNKKILASIIFSSSDNVDIINSIAHPIIRNIILKQESKNNIFIEVPLLFESNMQDDFDKIILVTANKDIRIKRAIARDNTNQKAIEDRMKYQVSNYENKCIDYIIANDKDIENLKKQVRECLCILKDLQ